MEVGKDKMVQKIGCGRHITIGYNKILDCPINFQCGMSREYGVVMLCDYCKNIKLGKGNSVSA